MRKVPDTYLFEPWNMPQELQDQLGIRVGLEIPLPIVDLAIATKEAKSRLYGRRQLAEVRIAKQAVLEKHGSRKTMHRTKTKASPDRAQLGFDF
jgi:deoxyribodipyrimidine photo-lyase